MKDLIVCFVSCMKYMARNGLLMGKSKFHKGVSFRLVQGCYKGRSGKELYM